MITLSIDPSFSKGYAWSVYENGKYKQSGVCKKPKDGNLFDVVTIFLSTVGAMFPAVYVIVIEDQYLTMRAANPEVFKKMVRAASYMEYALYQHYDCKMYRINAKNWQMILTSDRRMKSADLKKLSIQYASSVAGCQIKSDDEADAICIGQWACKVAEPRGYKINGLTEII